MLIVALNACIINRGSHYSSFTGDPRLYICWSCTTFSKAINSNWNQIANSPVRVIFGSHVSRSPYDYNRFRLLTLFKKSRKAPFIFGCKDLLQNSLFSYRYFGKHTAYLPVLRDFVYGWQWEGCGAKYVAVLPATNGIHLWGTPYCEDSRFILTTCGSLMRT